MADQAVTLATATSASNGVKIAVLSAEVAAQTGFTHAFRVPFDILNNSSWTTQGDTVTVTLGTTSARYQVDRVAVNVPTAFATTGTLTISVGTSSNTALALAAASCKSDTQLTAAAGCVTANKVEGTSAATLQCRFTTQGSTGAPSDITAGVAEIFLRIIDVAALI